MSAASPIAVQILQLALRGLAGVGDRLDDRVRRLFTEMGIPVPPNTAGEEWSRSVRALADKLEGQGGLDRFIEAVKQGRELNGQRGVERLVTLLKKK